MHLGKKKNIYTRLQLLPSMLKIKMSMKCLVLSFIFL